MASYSGGLSSREDSLLLRCRSVSAVSRTVVMPLPSVERKGPLPSRRVCSWLLEIERHRIPTSPSDVCLSVSRLSRVLLGNRVTCRACKSCSPEFIGNPVARCI